MRRSSAVRSMLPETSSQRCRRNTKKEVADDLRSIFYASSRKKADEFAVAFAAKWEKDMPSAVKCLSNSLDACLTFFSFPEEEWISLRTTNVAERLNKEFPIDLKR